MAAAVQALTPGAKTGGGSGEEAKTSKEFGAHSRCFSCLGSSGGGEKERGGRSRGKGEGNAQQKQCGALESAWQVHRSPNNSTETGGRTSLLQ